MKKYISFAVICHLLLMISLSSLAQFQPTEVIKSQQKNIINDKVYYIHTVKPGQTFFSICKAYGVTQDEVEKENPGIDPENIREGQAIRIPEIQPGEVAVYPDNREDFYAHKVRRRETVISIARRYRITEDVIYRYNPWARDGIQPNQTLWIPKEPESEEVSGEYESEGYYYYTTREKDTLYSISTAYGVTVADIIENNPVLVQGLHPGQVLKIPKISEQDALELARADSLEALVMPCIPTNERATYDVVLILPFFAKITMDEAALLADSLDKQGNNAADNKLNNLRGRNFAEFYEGFLLAVDSLKKRGLSINLRVEDSERDTLNIKRIVRDLTYEKPDLIIGPVYSEDVEIAGKFAMYQDIGLVSPLSTRNSLVAGNHNIIQVVPSREGEADLLANYIKENVDGNIILIRGNDSISINNCLRFKQHFQADTLEDTLFHTNQPVEYVLNDSLMIIIDKILSEDEENNIVVFSENEAEVSRLITILYIHSMDFPIKLYGMPAWQTWENELEYLHHLGLTIVTPFYTDYMNPSVRRFLHKCRIRLGYEPYEISSLGYNFIMLGYDVGSYFLSALMQYGSDFRNCINEVESDQLLSRYKFERTPGGGYVNKQYHLIRYNSDFTVEEIGVSDE